MKKLIFLALRDDGLGERLRALLHAMTLSTIFDCEFKFTWPKKFNDFMVTEDVDQVFSKEFIENNYIQSHNQYSPKEIRKFYESKNNDAYFCEPIPVFVNNDVRFLHAARLSL